MTSGGIDDDAFDAAEPPPLSTEDVQFGKGACRTDDLGCIKV
jgi:hypothetical protein